jgi:hypothetical protein
MVRASTSGPDGHERRRCSRDDATDQALEGRPDVALRSRDTIANDHSALVVDDSSGQLRTPDVDGQVQRIHVVTVAVLTCH